MMRWNPRRPGPRRVLALAMMIGLVAVGANPSAYSDPAPGSGHELPGTIGVDFDGEGAVGSTPTALTPRAKLILTLPGTLGWVLNRPKYRDPYVGLPPRQIPALPAQWQSTVPGCVVKGRPVWVDLYAIGPNPGGHPVGEFPPTKVAMAAFGSIPVTATLHLSQVVDGELVPIKVDFWPMSGATIACDPAWRSPAHDTNISYATGRLSMSVSDVAIDGQPVDVGSRCRTVAPLDLNLWGANDYVPVPGGYLYQREDTSRHTAGGYLKHPGSTDLTIPAFTGCRSAAGEDVSRLITATISGPGNQLAIHQGQVSLGGDRDDPTACIFDPNTGKTVCPTDYPPAPTIPVPAD